LVKAKYDPASKNIEYKVTEKMSDPTYTVIVSAKAGGKPYETRWGFLYQGPGVTSAPPAAATTAPEAPAEPAKKKRK
jgi:hypothetical protein